MQIVLEVVEDNHSTFYEIESQVIIIGRDPDKCDIILKEDGSSKEHCALEYKNEKWWIIDLKSKNGTLINNVPVKRHLFSLEDVIQIGEAYLRFSAAHMSLTTNQKLKKPNKKNSFNKSITLVHTDKGNSDQLFSGEHHGLKEVTMVENHSGLRKKKKLIRKKKVLKKKKKSA